MNLYYDVSLKKDTFTDIRLKYAERLGQTKLRLLWESDSRNLEVIPSEYLYNELYSSLTPFLFNCIPSITNSTTSGLINRDHEIALVGIPEVITLYARDKYGNK